MASSARRAWMTGGRRSIWRSRRSSSQFGKGSIMRMGESTTKMRGRGDPDRARSRSTSRSASAASRAAGSSRSTARIVRQDDARLPRHRRGAADGRHRGLHRRRARARSRSTPASCGVEHRQSARLAAGHRRAGAGDHRGAGPQRRASTSSWSTRSRRSCRARRSKATWATAHVGLQARLMSQALRKLTGAINRSNTVGHLHQPAPREDRRDVRQPGDDPRRPGAEVLRLRAAGGPPRRTASSRARTSIGSRVARESRQEQGRAALQAGGVRHHVRGRASRRRGGILDLGVECGIDPQERRVVLPTAKSALGQGRENAKDFLKAHPEMQEEIYRRILGIADKAADDSQHRRDRDIGEAYSTRPRTTTV